MGAVVLATAVGSRMINQNSVDSENNYAKRVNLISVKDYQKAGSYIFGDGAVESLEQAELRSQVSAPVLKINVAVGERVARDQALVNLQNSDFIAQLGQAQAGLVAQQSRLAEMKKGVRPEDLSITKTELDKAKQGLANTYSNTSNVLSDAYAKADDAVRRQLDPFFDNDEQINQQLTFYVDPQIRTDVESGRLKAGSELNIWREEISKITATSTNVDLDSVILKSKNHIAFFKLFLNRVSDTVRYQSGLQSSVLDAYRAYINIAKTEVNAASAALAGQEQAISSQELIIQGIEDQIILKQAGYTAEQIASQEAAVRQASEAVNGLNAQVAKTVIRSPIDGVISAIPARIGELASPGQLVISVVNKDWLKVKSFISAQDVSLAEESADAIISDNISGRVSRIAPSIDSATKKVQVDVIISDPKASNLVVGQNVSVRISAKRNAGSEVVFLLPLQAVKITNNGSFVYVVENDSLSEKPVQIGQVSGEFVEVNAGVSVDMKIVSPVYEMKDGEKVLAN